MRWLAIAIGVIQGMACFLAAGELVPSFSEDQVLIQLVPDGHFGQDLGARGRRVAAGWSGVDNIVLYHWDTGTRRWEGLLSTGFDGMGIALDAANLLFSSASGAIFWLFDDDTGQTDYLGFISAPVPPSDLAISFPHAALAFPDEGSGVVRFYHYNLSSLGWENAGEVTGSTVVQSGNEMVVGIPAVGTSGTGAVNIYQYANDQWGLMQTLWGQDPGSEFGASVALSGFWLAVGAPAEDTSFPQTLATDIGAVHLYKWEPTQFEPTATFYGKRDFDRFGTSVDLRGRTLAVGSPYEDIEAGQFTFPNVGAAYVYWRTGDLWSTAARLHASQWSAHDNLGFSVAISGHGVFAGAPYAEGPGDEHDAGAVYFWSRTIAIFNDGFESGSVSRWSASSL